MKFSGRESLGISISIGKVRNLQKKLALLFPKVVISLTESEGRCFQIMKDGGISCFVI